MMGNTKTKSKPSAKYSLIVSVLLMVVLLVLSYVAVAVSVPQKTYELAVGDTAPETIRATEDVEDTAATEKLRELARQSVKPVYMIDSALADRLCTEAAAAFASLEDIVLSATESRLLANVTEEYPSVETWKTILSSERIASLCASCSPALEEDELFSVLSASAQQRQFMRDTVLARLDSLLHSGLAETGLEAVQSALSSEISASLIAMELKSLAAKIAVAYAEPTYVVDEAATLEAQAAAAAATAPVTVEKGEIIVREGAAVTDAQYGMLKALGLIKTKASSVLMYVAIGVYLLTAFAFFFMWFLFMHQNLLISARSMLVVAVFVAVSLALNMLCLSVSAAFSASLIAVMLVFLLVGPRPAIAVSVLMAAVSAIMASGHTGVMGFDSAVACAGTLAAGFAVCCALRSAVRRSSMITAGLISGGVAALIVAAIYLLAGKTTLQTVIAAGWAFGGNVICAVLCVGTLSLWELAFDVATPARLSELTNANHPLLKQLMTDAPGTYHHSVMTASLAEAAAEAIGANALLARVGAYYHDVGKLRRPLYFLENQKGENIHDRLTPEESAAIIIAHQRDGVALLTKYKLPSQVIRICGEHHGSSLVSYFYYKACEAAGRKDIDQTPFRYPGQRPSTKESAIVMMADCCEAAVRSLGETTLDKIEAMVHKLIWDMVVSGAIGSAPLTLADLRTIEKTFVNTFVSLSHDRIEYPEFNDGGEDDA